MALILIADKAETHLQVGQLSCDPSITKLGQGVVLGSP